MKARIIEIFSSIQGEGLWVGKPQLFVRFHGCKLKCQYCDTPLTHHTIHQSRIEHSPQSHQFEKHSLEFSVEELNSQIFRFSEKSLAITGGEPLEQVDFIQEWLASLQGKYEVLLETSGVESSALGKVISLVNMVSLDIKIPSATKEKPYWKIHDEFIAIAKQKVCYAKLVFDEGLLDEEIEQIMMLMNKHHQVSFIFQPVSPVQKRDMKKWMSLFSIFSQKYPNQVRLIPQMHKFLGLM